MLKNLTIFHVTKIITWKIGEMTWKKLHGKWANCMGKLRFLWPKIRIHGKLVNFPSEKKNSLYPTRYARNTSFKNLSGHQNNSGI